MLRRLAVALPLASLFLLAAAASVLGHEGHDHRSSNVELRGRVVETHGDTFAGSASGRTFFLETTAGERLRLDVAGRQPRPGDLVRVRGQRRGDTLVADGASGVTVESSLLATTAPATTKRVAVIAFNFSNNTSQPFSTEQMASAFFGSTASVRAYFAEASYGSMTITGDVFGWFTIPATNQTCDATGTWATQARQAAAAAGVRLDDYTNVAFVFPQSSACSWAGLAYMPGRDSWNNGTISVRVAGHELAHNFGIHHASAQSCTDGAGTRVTLSATCTSSEYGDPFDIMGNTSRLPSAWHRFRLGFVPADEIVTVTSANAGRFEVGVASQATARPKTVRVARGDGLFYYLEYRRPFGAFDNFTTSDPAVNGVLIRIAPDRTNARTLLLDATPGTVSFADAALAAGRTFVDPAGIAIGVESVSTTGATVTVRFNTDLTRPSAPAQLVASPTTTTISLSWGAATDDVGVAGYRIARDGALVGETAGRTFTDTWRSPGTGHTYTVAAYDAAGNVGPAATVTASTLPDTTAPSGVTQLAATAGTTTARLAWGAASDDVGVSGYRITRQGVVVATVTGTAFDDSGLAPATAYSYQVAAVDRSGNVGPAAGATVTTTADGTAPTAPRSVTATAKSWTSIALAWGAATDDVGVTGYRITRNGTALTVVSGLGFTDRNLLPGRTYTYTIAARDAAGNLGPAVTVSATTPADTTRPMSVSNLTAKVVSSGTVSLVWSPATDNVKVRGYRVYRDGVYVKTVTTTSTSLTAAAGWRTFSVRAIDTSGNIGPSVSVGLRVW